MGIKYKIIPASASKHTLPIMTAGSRAFKDDPLAAALFPSRLKSPDDPDVEYRFRLQRLKDRFATKGAHLMVAVPEDEENELVVDGEEKGDGKGQMVLGYSGWYEPNPEFNQARLMMGLSSQSEEKNGKEVQQNGDVAGEKEERGGWVDDGHGGKRGDGKTFSSSLDVGFKQRVGQLLEETKKEVLGDDENRVWYLVSLAVDPSYTGQGIASRLVEWGVDKAAEEGLSAYTESTPAGVGVYRKLGFTEVKKIRPLEEDGDHALTVFVKRPQDFPQLFDNLLADSTIARGGGTLSDFDLALDFHTLPEPQCFESIVSNDSTRAIYRDCEGIKARTSVDGECNILDDVSCFQQPDFSTKAAGQFNGEVPHASGEFPQGYQLAGTEMLPNDPVGVAVKHHVAVLPVDVLGLEFGLLARENDARSMSLRLPVASCVVFSAQLRKCMLRSRRVRCSNRSMRAGSDVDALAVAVITH
ncbi:hypothetical protein NA57DRAFT_51026 [Rhizodiscina lignyota]|uniref:N-acetyltransferase domain-containing protein n=1 Tax=Rhizodiscina lignyota TaxID=1504668 RepID=A0A9P4IQZ5_9PEZI|nr:hypothetical protein NA57DRAFT_51026 [Rhizodiscina lignyota]